MTFPAENIRDWRNENLVDSVGDKVGTIEAIYFDTSTDDAVFASVQIGMVGRHKLTFVPLYGAVVAPSYVKVTADKKTIKDAPTIDTDGELTSDLEPALFTHYGLTYQPGVNGERRLGRR
ncbi:PRC-barrel domain-containing protein [uncultured Jatrophihabitans sp.]|uniref:PRC-barrel domain-containing protein n=1 Tax=uncultured Jatrophihabitans sp. TaxID=1610747 RepID=UPI0035CAC302